LNLNICDWDADSSYQKLKSFIQNLAVVNDTSEWAIKLIQEYVDSTRDEMLRQDLLVVAKDVKSKINSKNMKRGYFY